uniref:Schlafen AlbA-2 domain-containing protein n=1 Tax=Strigamia maritima TaxID=126957 RepID=T1J2C2_STRMM
MTEYKPENFPFYIMFESVTFDEDYHHEFKGHRSISVEELPPSCHRPNPSKQHFSSKVSFVSRQSRQCVSKALNAFLNTGDGGCVYLGITDDGIVRGIQLTDFQQHHIELNVVDLMTRYSPPVPSDRIKIRFVPVITKAITNVTAYLEKLKQNRIEHEFNMKPHIMRTYDMCWCDYDADIRMSHNKILAPYVVEIQVLKFEVPPVTVETIGYDYLKYFYPIYESEEDNCHFRREASVNNFSKQEIYAISMDETETFCSKIINKLLKEKKQLQEENNTKMIL